MRCSNGLGGLGVRHYARSISIILVCGLLASLASKSSFGEPATTGNGYTATQGLSSAAQPSVTKQAKRNAFQRFGDAVAGSVSGAWQGVSGAVRGATKSFRSPGPSRSERLAKHDPTSLASKTVQPDAEFYVAAARLHEAQQSLDEAESTYRQALDINPSHLEAMLGYARLLDRRGKMAEATDLYLKATRRHPKKATIFNDLGLCYARQGELEKSAHYLERAVTLDPQRKLYRNNLATVLVEMGRTDHALHHLVVAHGKAVGHYNLGYLLTEKGDQRAAIPYFARAVELDPGFDDAKRWLALATRQPPSNNPTTPHSIAQHRAAKPPAQNGSMMPMMSQPPRVAASSTQPRAAQPPSVVTNPAPGNAGTQDAIKTANTGQAANSVVANSNQPTHQSLPPEPPQFDRLPAAAPAMNAPSFPSTGLMPQQQVGVAQGTAPVAPTLRYPTGAVAPANPNPEANAPAPPTDGFYYPPSRY